MAHYQFETLHPFTDGNGRISRLVAVLQLLQEGALRSPVLSVSPWLKDHATDYRDHLLNVSRTGEWGAWVEFFATAVREEARTGHDRSMRLLALREELGKVVRGAMPRGRLAVEITDDLIAYPILSVADAQRRYGHSNQVNRNAIGSLVYLGILEPYGNATYDRLYWNRRFPAGRQLRSEGSALRLPEQLPDDHETQRAPIRPRSSRSHHPRSPVQPRSCTLQA